MIHSSLIICDSIKSVKTIDDLIYVEFAQETVINRKMVSNFRFSSILFNNIIDFPVDSAEFVDKLNNMLVFRFNLPVLANYTGDLICSLPSKYNIGFVDHQARVFPISLSKKEFSENPKYSEMKCFGNDYATRWCEVRNLAFFNSKFHIFSPAHYTFPDPFIVPGARAPPFDQIEDRFKEEPIVIQGSIKSFSTKLETINEVAYIYGTFYNYHMLWHVLFDFIIPFKKFLEIRNGTDTSSSRRVYVRSNGVWMYHKLMLCMTEFGIEIINKTSQKYLFPQAIIGIQKPEKDPDPKRPHNYSLVFEYNFNESTIPYLRDEVLSYVGINKNLENGHPLILVINRHTRFRSLNNAHQIVEAARRSCLFCDVRLVHYEFLSVYEQLRLSSQSSAIIGVHGGGLSHVMWMKRSKPEFPTHLVEILPYKYDCRNWYETAAIVAGVKYHSVMNTEKNLSESIDSNLDYCTSGKGRCIEQRCHDYLRDQNTTLEIDTFLKLWKPIVKTLEDAKALLNV